MELENKLKKEKMKNMEIESNWKKEKMELENQLKKAKIKNIEIENKWKEEKMEMEKMTESLKIKEKEIKLREDEIKRKEQIGHMGEINSAIEFMNGKGEEKKMKERKVKIKLIIKEMMINL